MKLLRKYRTYTYVSLAFVLIIGFLSNYHLFKHLHFRTADEVILEYHADIQEYADKHKTLSPLMTVNSKFGWIRQVDESFDLESIDTSIKDTLAYDYYQDESIIFRKMVFPVVTPEATYVVQLMLPTLEEDYFIVILLLSLLIFTILFFSFTTITDLLFTRKIFNPFHNILKLIKTYNIEKRTQLSLDKYDIDEFRELSCILTEMMNKINKGYYEMKEFLEFTSHELQTPLSVMQLKLETLSQKTVKDEEMLHDILSIQTSLRKVILFNRSILFIAKIRNGQYSERKVLNLRILFNNYTKLYEELLTMRNISVSIVSSVDCKASVHPVLAEHLVQNLLTNAIKHNFDGGRIDIASFKDRVVISNTFDGVVPKGDLFEKYNHSKEKCDSSGLGLAIVKTICMKSELDVVYRIEGNRFVITLSTRK